MAGAFTKANAGKLAERLGRSPTEGELYIAHFLGPDRREPADRAGRSQPADAGGRGVSRARRAPIRSIFYDGRGNARSAGEVYRVAGRPLRRGARRAGARRRAVAAAAADDAARAAQRVRARHRRASPRPMRRRRAMSPAAQARRHRRRCSTACSAAAARREPVAPLVSALWTAPQPPDGCAATARSRLRRTARAGRAGRSRRRRSACSRTSARRARAVSRPGLSAFRIR